jgi:hypothetical protein
MDQLSSGALVYSDLAAPLSAQIVTDSLPC